jgi:hypothetical protein
VPEKTPDLDNLLEEGLEAWADTKPAPGLEERVLARLRREPATTPVPEESTRRWPWLLLAAAALLIAAAGLLRIRSASPRIAMESVSPAPVAPAGENIVMPRATPEAARPTRIAEAAVSAAKPPVQIRPRSPSPIREVFPSPSPLGEEDRLLLAYVAATPLDEMKNHLGFLDAPTEMTEETKENR